MVFGGSGSLARRESDVAGIERRFYDERTNNFSLMTAQDANAEMERDQLCWIRSKPAAAAAACVLAVLSPRTEGGGLRLIAPNAARSS